jgi:hypothetical protein
MFPRDSCVRPCPRALTCCLTPFPQTIQTSQGKAVVDTTIYKKHTLTSLQITTLSLRVLEGRPAAFDLSFALLP